jgi:hypothetical protein
MFVAMFDGMKLALRSVTIDVKWKVYAIIRECVDIIVSANPITDQSRFNASVISSIRTGLSAEEYFAGAVTSQNTSGTNETQKQGRGEDNRGLTEHHSNKQEVHGNDGSLNYMWQRVEIPSYWQFKDTLMLCPSKAKMSGTAGLGLAGCIGDGSNSFDGTLDTRADILAYPGCHSEYSNQHNTVDGKDLSFNRCV